MPENNIIEFKSRDKMDKEYNTSNLQQLFNSIQEELGSIKTAVIFTRDEEDNISLYISDDTDLADKSVLIQLLQHNISKGLDTDDEDIEMEPNI